MTTTSAPLDGGMTVSVKDPAQLIAAVPHLLGFRPADSVVVLGLGGSTGQRIGPVLRVDLPAGAMELEVAAGLATVFTRHPGRAVTILIVGRYGGQPPDPGRVPHHRLVNELTAAFEILGRPVEHALWTPEIRAGAPWECYDKPKCTGVLPDDAATPVAAAVASKGYVTFDSREQMERQLDPDDPLAVARRDRLLASGIAAVAGQEDSDSVRVRSFREVRMALDLARQGRLGLSDQQVVRLALALSDRAVLDACLAAAVPPGSERSMWAEALWLELVRKLPAPERAEPATLLAYSAYVRGDGAFARAALENALDAAPEHTLAGLLVRCLDHAMAPHRLHQLGHAEHLAKLFEPAIPDALRRRDGPP